MTTEPQPNLALIGFPPPPYRIAGVRGTVARFAGHMAIGILFFVAITLPIAVLGFTDEARALWVDSALSLGLGAPAPDVAVSMREIDSYRSTGRYGTSGWDAVYELSRGGAVEAHAVELDSEDEAGLHRGAGTAFGALGMYWPGSVMRGRWMDYALLLAISGGLMLICHGVRKAARGMAGLAAMQDGNLRTVELMTRGGRALFTYLDQAGVRRFAQSESAANPLHVDALLTTGVALVRGERALLLDDGLRPLVLPEEERAAILERVGAVFRAGMMRRVLPAQPGDAATLAGTEDADALGRLFFDAWRFTWDNDDAALSGRGFDARDAIAVKLGAERAWAALRESREVYSPLSLSREREGPAA